MSMADKEAAEGSGRRRRRMDPNLYVSLPSLPQPRVCLDTSAASTTLMANSTGTTTPATEAPRTGEPNESLASAVAAYSPSNALTTPEEHPMLDPIVYSWLDDSSASGQEYTYAPEPSAQSLVDHLLVARSVRPSRVAAATGTEMVNTSTFGWFTQGAAAAEVEAGAPEHRFRTAIQISHQHNIVRPWSANRNQEGASADADSLFWAIQHSHSSFQAARRQNLQDGDDNSSFECNICLEVAIQPVVTSCGHLFCWPCLYQWLHAESNYFECPVCKGEVLKRDVTPIYRRGGEEQGGSTANPALPPRPQANRRESLRQQLQMAGNAREMGRVQRQLIQNQSQGWGAGGLPTPAGVDTTSVPAAQQRAGARRRQRQDSASRSIHSDSNNAAPVVLAAPQQSSLVEQLPTSSTAAAVVGEPGPSRRSRRSLEPPTTRRTRRRPQ